MQKNSHVIINKNSGAVLRLGEDTVQKMIEEAFGTSLASLHMIDTKEICPAVDSLVHAGAASHLVVGGGDGSAVCVAEHLMGRNIHFGVLPLGTMNLLAQDLGASSTFEETMKNFAGFKEDHIDAGMVNDRLFLCSAVIGLIPESALVREELRGGLELGALARFVAGIARGMGGIDKQSLQLSLSEDAASFALETTSLIISNNRFLRRPEDPAARFLRESLKDGKLAVYSAAPSDMIDGLRLVMKMVQGAWQEDDSVLSFETSSLIVDAKGRDILVSLDGEPIEMTLPLKFFVQSTVLPVLRMELVA